MNDQQGHQSPTAEIGSAAAGWSPNRRRFLSIAGLAIGGAAIGTVAGCGTAQTSNSGTGTGTSGSTDGGNSKGRSGAAGETLFVAGFQRGTPTSFNPYGPAPAFPTNVADNQPELIYECLVRFNMLDGTLAPGLAKELQEPAADTFVLPLQDGTKWSDGSELTAADVAFTYDLGKQTALTFSTVWDYVDSIEATDPRTVTVKLKKSPYNPLLVKGILASTAIVPKAIWSKISPDKVVAEPALKPVGSGPFKLDLADRTQVNLVRDDNYWGNAVFGKPPMATVNHPIFKSNNDGARKLESGEIDASQQFIPQIWTMWEDKQAPIGTWLGDKPYYLPGNISLLIFNTTKKGLDNPKVRLAIAYAINTPKIASTVLSGYSASVQPSLMIPSGYESKYFDRAAADADGWKNDTNKAIEILEGELKATKGSDGVYVLPDGTRLGGWKATCPASWTDWQPALEIVATSCAEIGIDISTEFPTAATWTEKIQAGDFDLIMNYYAEVSPASPWRRFHDAMDIRGVPGVGEPAGWNYGRYANDRVAALLDTAAGASGDDEAKAAYAQLDKVFRQEVPCVPLLYRPLSFYQFNQSTWENFPIAENPYAPPMWGGAGIEWFFKLRRVGG